MKHRLLASFVARTALALGLVQSVVAFEMTYDFNTAWSGDYAPGWENTAYRHGTAPTAQMMQQTSTGRNGSFGVQLSAKDPLNLFWVGVNPTGIDSSYLDKQYNPYFSAWYYEENSNAVAGQIFAVPDSPIPDNDDWTDIQFGGRRQPTFSADFNFIAASMTDPFTWVDTNVPRSAGWHELTMQLLASDGRIHFTLDGVAVGATTRNDYTNLGTVGLYTMFDSGTLGTSGVGSSTIWDDVRVGSSVPDGGTTLTLLGCALTGLGALRRKFVA